MAPPQKVALGITSYSGPLYPDGKNTGAFFSEVYDPYMAYTKAGFDVDIVSETGSYGWDEHSLDDQFLSSEMKAALQDPNHKFSKAVAAIKKASEVNPKDYGIFNAAGGHGTIFDFDGKAPNLANLASQIWANGGLVAAVCHGPCLLPDIKDPATNKSIADGKNATGFPDDGEVAMKMTETLDSKHLAYTSNLIKKSGANYQACPKPFEAKVVKDGRLITGANPASATPAAEEAIKAFQGL